MSKFCSLIKKYYYYFLKITNLFSLKSQIIFSKYTQTSSLTVSNLSSKYNSISTTYHSKWVSNKSSLTKSIKNSTQWSLKIKINNFSSAINKTKNNSCSGKSSSTQNKNSHKDSKFLIVEEKSKANISSILLILNPSKTIKFVEAPHMSLYYLSTHLNRFIMRLYTDFHTPKRVIKVQSTELLLCIFSNINFGAYCTVLHWALKHYIRTICLMKALPKVWSLLIRMEG